jgi:hypothetical protein
MIGQVIKADEVGGRVIRIRCVARDGGTTSTVYLVVRPGEMRGGMTFDELWEGPDVIEVADGWRLLPRVVAGMT